jgi:hypothetical protein
MSGQLLATIALTARKELPAKMGYDVGWPPEKKKSLVSAGTSFFLSRFFPLIHFVPLDPSVLLHVTYVPCYCPYTTNTAQTSMPRRDSNPQSQQANGRKPTP